MNWRKMFLCGGCGVLVLLLVVNFTQADVITANLAVWLDAGDYDADGIQGIGTGTTWKNCASSGSLHDAILSSNGGGPLPSWAGSGTAEDPYRVQFRRGSSQASGGHALILNSATDTDLATTVFTYEIWARRNNGGHPDDYSVIIAHGGVDPNRGTGGIYTKDGYAPDGKLWTIGGNPHTWNEFPNSYNDFTSAGYHQFVFVRAGDGANDSAYYYDGVLQGTFQSASSANGVAEIMIAVRKFIFNGTPYYDWNMDMDVLGVRIYTAALNDAEVLANYNAGIRYIPIPEPNTLTLLSMCIGGLAIYGWKKRKYSSA